MPTGLYLIFDIGLLSILTARGTFGTMSLEFCHKTKIRTELQYFFFSIQSFISNGYKGTITNISNEKIRINFFRFIAKISYYFQISSKKTYTFVFFFSILNWSFVQMLIFGCFSSYLIVLLFCFPMKWHNAHHISIFFFFYLVRNDSQSWTTLNLCLWKTSKCRLQWAIERWIWVAMILAIVVIWWNTKSIITTDDKKMINE